MFIEKYENFINKLSTGKSLLENIINKYRWIIRNKNMLALKINITNLDEKKKSQLRGALKFFSGEKNNTPVQVVNGEQILDCGTIYLTKEILKEFEELLGTDKVNID